MRASNNNHPKDLSSSDAIRNTQMEFTKPIKEVATKSISKIVCLFGMIC